MNSATLPSETPVTEAEPTFDDLPLTAPVRRAIDEVGWTVPTPVQLHAYGPAVEGKDLIVQARTGTGKTAAFGLPLIDRLVRKDGGVQALILAPTRELALQSQRELEQLGKHSGARVAAVYGGAPMPPQVRQLSEGATIVSGTPGRVLDHLRRGTLDATNLRVLVLDEADEMLSMGFAKELHSIMEILPTPRQTLLFSATVDDAITRMADRHMKDPEHIMLSGDAVGATGINHFVYMVSGKGRTRDLLRLLEVEDPESAIVFCNTKVETERVAAELTQAGYDADWLNGDLPQGDREKVMARTRKSELRFLVATDVAARGIDISHLTHVINYTLPESAAQYIHRTGRTGRAGRTGTALSLVSPLELGTLYFLRLQYKIFPVERALPSAGEERTRAEADRIVLLEEAAPARPSEMDMAVARRLLTHPDAERVLAGLLQTFFGARGEDVDEQAAAARRSRPPAPVAEPEAPPTRTDGGGRGRGAEASRAEASPEAARERPRRRRRGRDGEARAAEDTPEELTRPEGDTPEEPSRPAGAPPEATTRGHSPAGRRGASADARAEGPERERGPEHGDPGAATLYISVGRRDGIRAGELARLVRDRADLTRREVGRIRVRDKHSFVTVPEERADAVVAALSGAELEGRELLVERAKSDA
jgi:ATP-dependent RNA helicase DeaD